MKKNDINQAGDGKLYLSTSGCTKTTYMSFVVYSGVAMAVQNSLESTSLIYFLVKLTAHKVTLT